MIIFFKIFLINLWLFYRFSAFHGFANAIIHSKSCMAYIFKQTKQLRSWLLVFHSSARVYFYVSQFTGFLTASIMLH